MNHGEVGGLDPSPFRVGRQLQHHQVPPTCSRRTSSARTSASIRTRATSTRARRGIRSAWTSAPGGMRFRSIRPMRDEPIGDVRADGAPRARQALDAPDESEVTDGFVCATRRHPSSGGTACRLTIERRGRGPADQGATVVRGWPAARGSWRLRADGCRDRSTGGSPEIRSRSPRGIAGLTADMIRSWGRWRAMRPGEKYQSEAGRTGGSSTHQDGGRARSRDPIAAHRLATARRSA